MKVSVVIVSYNTAELTQKCLNSVEQHTKTPHEIIVVDNNSLDGTATQVEETFPAAFIVRSKENLGFSKGSNLGARSSHGEQILFLNSDVQVKPGAIDALVSYLETHNEVGVVGPRFVFPDGSFQLSAGNLPGIWQEWKDRRLSRRMWTADERFRDRIASVFRNPCVVGWVTGACLLIRHSLFDALGGFDENLFLYFEDKDLCKRAVSLGAKVVYYPEAVVVHHLGASSLGNGEFLRRVYQTSHREYYRKHHGWISNLLLDLYLGMRS